MLVRRLALSLAAFALVGGAVQPVLAAVDVHSAPLSETPFRQTHAATAPAHSFADPAIGRDWATVSLPAR
jgi:hypothetical protein